MTNGYSNLKPNIALQTGAVFSAAMAASGALPLSSVTLTDLPEANFTLTLEVVCRCGENIVFEYPRISFSSFNFRLCGESEERTALIRFSAPDFEISYAFLNSLAAPADAVLTVSAAVDDICVAADAKIQLLPHDEWLGIENHPETLAAFVCPDCKAVDTLSASVKPYMPFSALADNVASLTDIVKNIRAASMICAARDSYSPERRQRIKSHTALCIPNSVAATPMELALLFCAAAERSGFAPVTAFATNLSGAVSLFCGVRACEMKSGVSTASESLSKLRAMLENGELILFDPAILSSAQSIDVSLAAAEAHGYFSKVSTKLIVLLDIAEARADGVMPFYAEAEETALPKSAESVTARGVLANLYNGLSGSRIFKALSGDFGGYDVIPLVDFPPQELVGAQSVVIGPMEISEKPSRFAGLSDDFASFALKDERVTAYNKAELEEVCAAFAAFRARISEKKYIVSGLYEKSFHERVSRMTFGKAAGFENYAVAGFLRLCERETGETRYLPLAFVRVSLARNFDYRFCPDNGAPILNSLAASCLGVKLPSDGKPDSIPEILAFFEKAAKAGYNDEYSEIRVIRETALIKADLADYILWNDIGQHARTMLKNKSFEEVLANTGTPETNQDMPEESVWQPFVRYAPETVKRALLYDGNAVVSGGSTADKEDLLVNAASFALAEGKTALAVSDDLGFLNFAAKAFEKAGLSETVLDLGKCRSPEDMINAVKERLAALSDLERTSAAPVVHGEFEETATRLKSYAKRVTEMDPSLGVSLLELIESFDNAYDASESAALLPVEKAAAENLNGEKLDALFDLAERLVRTARTTLGEASLSDSAPLKTHPLYALDPENMPDDAVLHEVYELIARILPALSEYRETFFEISPMLGIRISDITDLAGLYALNELYKLFISAREYDIPADFATNGLSAFADGESRRSHAKKRMENIEYQLRFFSPELFEDVDSLLSGYQGEKDDETNFIKKFLVKKNHKDVLLQYVSPENRAEFAKHPVSDIYKLLDEYRKEKMVGSDEPAEENAESLAFLVSELKNVLAKLYPADAADERRTDARLARLFSFIARLGADPALSKKLTFARARFAQVYSENECMLNKLALLIGADFRLLHFETGILHYDGLSAYLKRVEENLPALTSWVNWLDAKRAAEPFLPAFCSYLCETGVKPGTDRLFASSLLLPAVRFLIHKCALDTDRAAILRAKEKYPALAEKSASLALETALQTHRQRVKHYDETENLVSLLEADRALSASAFAAKHKKHLLRVFPILLVHAEDLGAFTRGECVAEMAVCDDSSHSSLVFEAVGAARRTLLLTHTRRASVTANMLLASGAKRAAFVGESDVLSHILTRKTSVSAVMVNGAMRFAADLANPAEAELCVAKALEFAKNGQATAIFAFTHGQCAYIRHLLCVTAENDKNVRGCIESGLVTVRDAYEPCYESFAYAVFSFGAAADTEGNLCRAFCMGNAEEFSKALKASLAAVSGQAVFVTSLSAKELDLFGRRQTAARELYYALRFAAERVTPFYASALSEESVLCEALLKAHKGSVPALGRFACGADAFEPESRAAYMYDITGENDLFERLCRCDRLSKAGVPCTLVSPLDAVWEENVSGE